MMLLVTAVFGGLLCVPYLPGPILFSRPPPGKPVGMLRRIMRCEHWRLRRRGPLPYAVAIAVGIMFALMQGA
jgi:prepilin peptidase CpaA